MRAMGRRRGAGLLGIAAAGIGATLVALGCGTGSGEGGGGASGCDGGCWQPSAAQQAFISSFCALDDACCAGTGLEPTTGSTCADDFQKSGLTSDAALQAACLQEMQSLAGTASCVPEAWDVLGDPCLRAVYQPGGPQRPGQPCTQNADCAGAPMTVTVCAGDPSVAGTFRKICLQMTEGHAGDHTCLGEATADGVISYAAFWNGSGAPISSGVLCLRRDGVYCDQTNDPTTNACVAFTPAGAPCSSGITCASGSCLTATSMQSNGDPGTCAETVSAGSSCAQAACDSTSFCDGTSLSCVAKQPAGTSCGIDGECESGNCDSTSTCSTLTSSEQLAQLGYCSGSI
jgi:hypothetical protein